MAHPKRAQNQISDSNTDGKKIPTEKEWWALVQEIVAKHSITLSDTTRRTPAETWLVGFVLTNTAKAKGVTWRKWLAPPARPTHRLIRWGTLCQLLEMSTPAVETHIESSSRRNRPVAVQDVMRSPTKDNGFYCTGRATGAASAVIGSPLESI